MKNLPKVIKNVKSFILDEDAKVIDSSFSKVAIFTGFLAVNFIVNIEDVNSGLFRKHQDNYFHNNVINAFENGDTNIHAGNNPKNYSISSIEPKTVETMHMNHYKHQNGKV